ncbi:MAG: hypothetical protein V1874_09395 [Spirochaetota bacterium]
MKPLLKIVIIFSLVMLLQPGLHPEDYQYQYFNHEKDKYVPFSDYIPKIRLHYFTVPHYLEDFYQLYGMKQHYNENSLRKNIDRLKTALACKFRHPSEALVKIDSEAEYLKYRRLMFMHLNILIMRNYMSIASRYDKQSIKFYNSPFAKEINESFDIAEKLYKEAIPYWENAKRYAMDASDIKITTDLGFIESERFSIARGDLSYGKIIDDHLKRLSQKRQKLNPAEASSKK